MSGKEVYKEKEKEMKEYIAPSSPLILYTYSYHTNITCVYDDIFFFFYLFYHSYTHAHNSFSPSSIQLFALHFYIQ